MFDKIRIVLVNTTHPGNIGAAARAMKIMGLRRLYLVAPRSFPHDTATARAVGAADLLESAVVVDTLAEAIADCGLVVGTSARERRIPWPQDDARGAAGRIAAAAGSANEVAILFGREDRGLTNDELHRCHFHLSIPTAGDYSALNLAAAVQVVSYEVLMATRVESAASEQPRDVALASADELERLLAHCEDVMLGLGFYDPANPKQLLTRLRRLVLRSGPDQLEVNILRGMLGATQRLIERERGR